MIPSSATVSALVLLLCTEYVIAGPTLICANVRQFVGMVTVSVVLPVYFPMPDVMFVQLPTEIVGVLTRAVVPPSLWRTLAVIELIVDPVGIPAPE